MSKKEVKPVRWMATQILLKVEKGSFSQRILDEIIKENHLNKQEAKFLTRLIYGVLEKKITIDYTLKELTKPKFHKLSLEILTILRIGAYQIIYMDGVPHSAAVNESVNLAYKVKQVSAKGLINGVLRKISRENQLLMPKDKNTTEYRSVQYGISEDIIDLWIGGYGLEKAQNLGESLLKVPFVSVRTNTINISVEKLEEYFKEKEISYLQNPWIKENFYLKNMGDITRISGFRKGYFFVQDTASQMAMEMIKPYIKGTILDMCGAPGGKSFLMANLSKDREKIIAIDKTEDKINKIMTMKEQLNITSITAQVGDSRVEQPDLPMADLVLCDVPCSGLGIMGKKPEIRFKTKEIWEQLYPIQEEILMASSKKVKVGGKLVYTTCTLNPRENEEIIENFLKICPNFSPCNLEYAYGEWKIEHGFYCTLFPDETETDGFFLSIVEKNRD